MVVLLQFQKQGKDMEKVKQRLAEIANYVDKVKNQINRGNAALERDLLEVVSSLLRINQPVSRG